MDPSWSAKALNTLSQQQLQLAIHVQRRLIAPCCYTQTIDVHSSEIAETMRQEVLQMVKLGKDERAIFAHYKAIYGEQILAVPDGVLGELAFAIPITSATAAFAMLTAGLMRFHRRKARMPVSVSGPRLGPLTETQQAIQDQIRDATAC